MKRKALCFILTLLAIAVFSLGCGGGGGSSNPASSNVAGFARVSGAVYDSSNNPVANANVRLVLSSNALINSLTSNTTSNLRLATNGNQTEFNTNTDNKGEYTFVNVPYGEYTLSAVTANGAQIVTNLVVKDEAVETPKIILKPFGSISGSVTYNNSPVCGAIVCLEGTSYCAITGTDGKYLLNNVPSNTDFNLTAMASGYTFPGKSINIIASEGLSLTEIELALSLSDQPKYTVNCKIEGLGKDLPSLLIIAFSEDGNNTYATNNIINASCSIEITASGTYSFIPAYITNGYNQSGTATGTIKVTDKQIQEGGKTTINLTMDSLSSPLPEYASLKLTLDTTSSEDFTACLYDSTGHEHKKTLTGNSAITFINLPVGIYSLAVYSETMLKVETGIELSYGETEKSITPVTVIGDSDGVTISPNSGIATLKLDYSSVNPATDVNKDNLYFSLISKGYDGTTTLFDENVATTTFKVTSGNITQNFSIDNLSPNTDSIAYIKFFFKNGLNKNVFEQSFFIQNPMTIAPDSFKRVSLGSLTQNTSEVILFNTININGQVGYLVITTDSAYIFNKEGTQLKVYSFTNELHTSIKPGNACYLEEEEMVLIQYLTPITVIDDNTGGNIEKNNLCIVGCKFENDSFSKVEIYSGYSDVPDGYDSVENGKIISANKILAKKNGSNYNIFSVCDDCVRYLEFSSLPATALTTPNQLCYFGQIPNLQDPDNPENIVTIATSSTIIKDNDNYKIYYLGQKYDYGSIDDTIYLVEGELKSPFNSVNEKIFAQIGNAGFEETISPPGRTLWLNGHCSHYYYYMIENRNDYPYSLTDCLDNSDAIVKLYLNNAAKASETKLIYSDTIYSGSNIESSFIKAGNHNAWICRSTSGHILVVRDKNFNELKINLKQVLNSFGYLENSISYTTDNKIHVICVDDSNNLQVLVLNCIESNN